MIHVEQYSLGLACPYRFYYSNFFVLQVDLPRYIKFFGSLLPLSTMVGNLRETQGSHNISLKSFQYSLQLWHS